MVHMVAAIKASSTRAAWERVAVRAGQGACHEVAALDALSQQDSVLGTDGNDQACAHAKAFKNARCHITVLRFQYSQLTAWASISIMNHFYRLFGE